MWVARCVMAFLSGDVVTFTDRCGMLEALTLTFVKALPPWDEHGRLQLTGPHMPRAICLWLYLLLCLVSLPVHAGGMVSG